MRKIFFLISMVAVSGFVFAASPGGVSQMTVGGVNIAGNTDISASAEGTSAQASSKAVARNVVGGIRGGTNIIGNTGISASAKDTSATAKDTATAENMVGGIGGQ
jgi:hypothetical protein